MKYVLIKIRFVFRLLILILIFHSCILDEFKANDIKIKENWNMDIVSPLFYGNFEFIDLIYKGDSNVPQGNEQTFTLQLPNESFIEIQSNSIFYPTVIIEDYSFLINGNYNLLSVSLQYIVSNGCPFPLNFQMRFHDKNSDVMGPPVIPPSFLAATRDGDKFVPETTKHTIPLNDEQLQSFKTSNRVEFSSWFDSSDLINQQDTFLSDYPVNISIVLYGEVE